MHFVKQKGELMNTIGSRLKEERAKLGLTQEKMALAGRCTKRTQIYYEANERSPDSNYLSSIAELGVDVNYVLTGRHEGEMLKAGKASNDPVSSKMAKMLELFARLDDKASEEAIYATEKIAESCEVRQRLMKLERGMQQGRHQAAMA
jgi:transcriptional regulator with XRE-family HTH domain